MGWDRKEFAGNVDSQFLRGLRANTAFRNRFPVTLADGSIPGASTE
jgi:hypothetical protein